MGSESLCMSSVCLPGTEPVLLAYAVKLDLYRCPQDPWPHRPCGIHWSSTDRVWRMLTRILGVTFKRQSQPWVQQGSGLLGDTLVLCDLHLP